MRRADLHVAVEVQEGAQLDDQDALPLCPPSARQREEPLHITVLQREPEAPPPVGQDLQKEVQLCRTLPGLRVGLLSP